MTQDEIEHWMREALSLGRAAATFDEVPIGAVFVRDGKLLAGSGNYRERSRKATAHAEIVALEAYSAESSEWRLPPGTSLIVTAEPCLMCTGALIWARLENLYYGCEDPKGAGLRNVLPLVERGVFDHRFSDVKNGFLANECSGLLQEFFRAKREAKKKARVDSSESTG